MPKCFTCHRATRSADLAPVADLPAVDHLEGKCDLCKTAYLEGRRLPHSCTMCDSGDGRGTRDSGIEICPACVARLPRKN